MIQLGITRIVAAAIKIPNNVYGGDLIISAPPPARHFTLLHPLHDLMGYNVPSEAQGFLTCGGDFVRRDIAYGIALYANQLLDGRGEVPGTLYSEDLW